MPARAWSVSVSPSQLDTWRSCHRKWAFTYISGLPRPPETKAQRIGIALHAKAETFIKTGVPDYGATTEDDVEAARLLPAILPYLPKGATAEQKIKVTLDGVDFGGRYDWLDVDAYDNKEVGDLKTTSSLRWAKTEEELAIHPQPLIYAKSTGAESCRWVYVQTKGAAHVREVRFKPDFSALPGIIADAKDITKAWADRGDPNTYEPNLGACEAYGGCPFKAHCKVDSGKRLAMLMGITAPKALVEPKEPPDMTTSFDALMAAINPPMQTVTRTEELPPVLAINPPPMPAAQDVGVTIPPTANSSPVAPSGGDSEGALKKRKRRTKAEMAAAKADLSAGPFPNVDKGTFEVTACEQVTGVLSEPKTDPAPADTANDKPIGTLYVGCQPDVAFENGAYIFNAANWEVSEAAGLSDYRQAEFNKLQGFFVSAVAAKVKDMRPEHLFIDTRWAETTACLATLIAMSDRVVRAL